MGCLWWTPELSLAGCWNPRLGSSWEWGQALWFRQMPAVAGVQTVPSGGSQPSSELGRGAAYSQDWLSKWWQPTAQSCSTAGPSAHAQECRQTHSSHTMGEDCSSPSIWICCPGSSSIPQSTQGDIIKASARRRQRNLSWQAANQAAGWTYLTWAGQMKTGCTWASV